MPSGSVEMPPASLALSRIGIPHQVFHHSAPVASIEQAAQERGQRPDQIVRSILFRLAEKEFAMVLVAGPMQISWKKLRRHVAQSRLTMASATEVLSVTGYRIGAVSPFGLPQPVRMLMDNLVLREDVVSIGSGIPSVAIIMTMQNLRRALPEVELADLCEGS